MPKEVRLTPQKKLAKKREISGFPGYRLALTKLSLTKNCTTYGFSSCQLWLNC